MKFELIIRNGSVVTPSGIFRWDIGVKNGKIAQIADALPQDGDAVREIDASGLHIFPGLIDSHVHFDEPGNAHREGFLTGSSSVAASGVTTFFDNPVTSFPPVTTPEAAELKIEAASKNSVIDYGILGGLAPDNWDQLEALKKKGVMGFKGFMSQNTGLKEFGYLDDMSLIGGLDQLAKIEGIAILHAENEAICSYLKAKHTAEEKKTFADYAASRPIISEVEAVRRAAVFAEITGCRVHIFHASSREVTEAVKEAKSRGVKITVETCPHYLCLTVQDMPKLMGATCAPPLRPISSVESMWEAVRVGDVDTIGSDHSSMPLPGKRWGGLSGGQSTLSVLLTEGYHKRGIALERIAAVTSLNPASLFGLYPQKGTIAVGSDGDFALVNLEEEFVLSKEMLLDSHSHSQYLGKAFRGAVKYTISRGEVVYENGKITCRPGRGRRVTPLHENSD
ncbi:allantoinase AllB [Lachnospiraceae bacterium 62-35]